MNLPNYIQSKIDNFKPQYQDLKFSLADELSEWLEKTSKSVIELKDSGQDLLKFHVAESGEIIHTEIQNLGDIYNGALLLDDPELIISGDNIRIWMPTYSEVISIRYEVEKVIRKQ